jgi:hypothetical protein
MACDLNTLLAQACNNKFFQLAQSDPKAARAVILELLCNISGGGIVGNQFTNRIDQPITSFNVNYTNTTGKPILLQIDVSIFAGSGNTPSQILLETGAGATLDEVYLNTPTATLTNIHTRLQTIMQPGDIVKVVDALDPALGNAILRSQGWY